MDTDKHGWPPPPSLTARVRTGVTKILVVSDIHYACDAEKARGAYELKAIAHPLLRRLVWAYRHYFWMRDPFAHNHLLDQLLAFPQPVDYVVANGDFSCDSAFIGLSDEAACQSAVECLEKLKLRFANRLRTTLGDHDLGKLSLFGGRGGMRLASWNKATSGLGLPPLWKERAGQYWLLGVTSSLIALPLFRPEILEDEWPQWQQLRERHLADIRQFFSNLAPGDKVILFAHDPTCLSFLWEEETVRDKAEQIERTIIGHLHTNLILWKGQLLAGMPPIRFLGNSIRRMSSALNQAKCWRHFKLLLCPSLAGSEFLKDGGYCTLEIDPQARRPALVTIHRLRRAPNPFFPVTGRSPSEKTRAA